MLTLEQLILITVIIALGAGLQGSFGFGAGLLANPILVLIDPDFIGVPMLMCAMLLNIMVLLRERSSRELRDVEWAIAGRILGTTLAAWLVTQLSQEMMTVAFSCLVLLAVILSITRLRVVVDQTSLLLASVAAGVMGTVASLGGLPLGLLYQHTPGPKMRPTMAVLLLTGNLLSVAALAMVGRLGVEELRLGLALLPGTIVGYHASSRLLSRIAPTTLHWGVLIISTTSALVALALQIF